MTSNLNFLGRLPSLTLDQTKRFISRELREEVITNEDILELVATGGLQPSIRVFEAEASPNRPDITLDFFDPSILSVSGILRLHIAPQTLYQHPEILQTPIHAPFSCSQIYDATHLYLLQLLRFAPPAMYGIADIPQLDQWIFLREDLERFLAGSVASDSTNKTKEVDQARALFLRIIWSYLVTLKISRTDLEHHISTGTALSRALGVYVGSPLKEETCGKICKQVRETLFGHTLSGKRLANSSYLRIIQGYVMMLGITERELTLPEKFINKINTSLTTNKIRPLSETENLFIISELIEIWGDSDPALSST